MEHTKSNLITLDFSMRWLFIPPVIAIFTIILTALSSSGVAVPVDPAIWGLVGLMFVLLTILYGIFIKQYFFAGLLPVQMIAQGILLCPLSLRMGAAALSWIGVTLAICGAVILVALYYRSRVNLLTASQVAPKMEMAALPLPFMITDAQGSIISASDFLLQLLQKSNSDVKGEKIDELLPFDKETASIGGREWRILQSPMEDGTQYFQLEEAREVSVTLPANTGNDDIFVDVVTSLYQQSYATKRVEEELYRIYRYKRWMSAALLCVNFLENEEDKNSSGLDSKKEKDIFNAYCRFVNSSIRETDISCLVAPHDILIAMPETSLEEAQTVVSKLLDFPADLQEQIRELEGSMEIIERTVFFNASSGVLDFDRLMGKLDEAMKS